MYVYVAVKFLETEKLLDEKAILMFLFLVNYMQGENSTNLDLFIRLQNSIPVVYYFFF